MSAAAEYYGYLLSQGYGEEQIARFAHFADQANKGIISQNQAFRMASREGWSNGEGDEKKGTFKDWVDKANDQGWIDKGLSIFGAMKESGMFSKKDRSGGGDIGGDIDYPPPPPKSNTMLYVIGGVIVIGIGAAIYFASKKK